MLRDEINTALREAMKARDERRVSTLRLVNAALKNADIDAQGRGKPVLSDEEILGLLQKLINRESQKPNPGDLSGILVQGSFSRVDRHVMGKWPVPREFMDSLASGS